MHHLRTFTNIIYNSFFSYRSLLSPSISITNRLQRQQRLITFFQVGKLNLEISQTSKLARGKGKNLENIIFIFNEDAKILKLQRICYSLKFWIFKYFSFMSIFRILNHRENGNFLKIFCFTKIFGSSAMKPSPSPHNDVDANFVVMRNVQTKMCSSTHRLQIHHYCACFLSTLETVYTASVLSYTKNESPNIYIVPWRQIVEG